MSEDSVKGLCKSLLIQATARELNQLLSPQLPSQAYYFDRWKSVICNVTIERDSVSKTQPILVPLLSMTLFLLAAAAHPLIGGFVFVFVLVGAGGLIWSELRVYLSPYPAPVIR